MISSIAKRCFLPMMLSLSWVFIFSPLSAFTWSESLTGGTSRIRRVHITELRDAVDAKGYEFGFSTGNWSGGDITGGASVIRAVHVNELRTRVGVLLNTYNPICPGVVLYSTAHWASLGQTVTGGVDRIRAIHITDLREAADAIGTCDDCCDTQECHTAPCLGGSGCTEQTGNVQGNQCAGICKSCKSGVCGNATNNTDPGDKCSNTDTCMTGLCNATGSCKPVAYGGAGYNCNGTDTCDCRCDGNGHCSVCPSGNSCNDYDSCTQNDKCNGSGQCQGSCSSGLCCNGTCCELSCTCRCSGGCPECCDNDDCEVGYSCNGCHVCQ